MDAREALAELTELSSQVEAAAVLGADGAVVASTLEDPQAANRLAEAARDALAAATPIRSSAELSRVEVALAEGSLFVVREGQRTAVATTIPRPTAGLVLYDLRTCLRRIEEPPPPRPRRRRKAADA